MQNTETIMNIKVIIGMIVFAGPALLFSVASAQAEKACPVNESFHVRMYQKENPSNPDACLCPEGTKWSNVSAAYRQCIGDAETACFYAVQGKLPWNKEGDTTWNPVNVKALCAGVEANYKPRIQCFGDMIISGTSWGDAIKQCAK